MKAEEGRPPKLLDPLRETLRARHYSRRKIIGREVGQLHAKDLAAGWGRVQMPDALDRKYPNAPAVG